MDFCQIIGQHFYGEVITKFSCFHSCLKLWLKKYQSVHSQLQHWTMLKFKSVCWFRWLVSKKKQVSVSYSLQAMPENIESSSSSSSSSSSLFYVHFYASMAWKGLYWLLFSRFPDFEWNLVVNRLSYKLEHGFRWSTSFSLALNFSELTIDNWVFCVHSFNKPKPFQSCWMQNISYFSNTKPISKLCWPWKILLMSLSFKGQIPPPLRTLLLMQAVYKIFSFHVKVLQISDEAEVP